MLARPSRGHASSTRTFLFAALLVTTALSLAPAASAQSINIDFGPVDPKDPAAHQPSSTYAAAGLPGYWNSIPAFHTTTTFDLIDRAGNVTPVRLLQIGGTQTLLGVDPATSGDDERLMDDHLITYNAVESCLFFDGLEPGTYTMLLYARMPNKPGVMSYTDCDEEPGNPYYQVGGVWPGGHEVLVTYSRHVAIVSENQRLRAHSGLVPGGTPSEGAALNGVQLHRAPDCPADVSPEGGDGQVSIADVVSVITRYGSTCGICAEDFAPAGGDGLVSIADVTAVLTAYGPCGGAGK